MPGQLEPLKRTVHARRQVANRTAPAPVAMSSFRQNATAAHSVVLAGKGVAAVDRRRRGIVRLRAGRIDRLRAVPAARLIEQRLAWGWKAARFQCFAGMWLGHAAGRLLSGSWRRHFAGRWWPKKPCLGVTRTLSAADLTVFSSSHARHWPRSRRRGALLAAAGVLALGCVDVCSVRPRERRGGEVL